MLVCLEWRVLAWHKHRHKFCLCIFVYFCLCRARPLYRSCVYARVGDVLATVMLYNVIGRCRLLIRLQFFFMNGVKRAFSRPRSQFFTIRTSQPANDNILCHGHWLCVTEKRKVPVSCREQIMFKEKYPSIFSRQREAIVFIIPKTFIATCALKIGEYYSHILQF